MATKKIIETVKPVTAKEAKFKLTMPKFLQSSKLVAKPDIKKEAKAEEILTPKQDKPPLFGVKTDSISQQLLRTDKSASNPNVELARVIAVWDMVMDEYKWEDCKFSNIIRDAQASVGGVYHNDIEEVAIAQEIQKNAERKGGKASIGLKILE